MSEDVLTFNPDYASPPGNTLRNVLGELGMTQVELAARAGWSEKFVSQMMTGKAPIGPATALQLERVIGTPASFWLNREANYRETLARIEEERSLQHEAELVREFPYNEMAKLDWVEQTRDRIERARNLLRFFGVASLSFLDEQPAAIFRVGTCADPSDCALMAWLRAGTLQAYEVATEPFNRGEIEQAVPEFRRLTLERVHTAIDRLREMLAESGVVLALVPALPKTAAHGATHWLGSKKVVLQLSDRYKRADIFWFSFFHEIGHLLLHGKRPGVYVNRLDRERDEKEREADRFARDTLIPPDEFAEFVNSDRVSAVAIRDFADAIGIHPGIVVGRLQHDGLIPHNRHNALRDEFHFEELQTSESPRL